MHLIFELSLRAYRLMRLVGQFVKKDVQLNGWRLTRIRFRYIRRGFHVDKTALYEHGSDGFPKPEYLSDFERLRTRYINNGYHDALNNKVLFSQVFLPFFRCPHNYGIVTRKGLYSPLDPNTDFLRAQTLESVIAAMPDRFVMKRVGGGGGIDIFVAKKENKCLLINGDTTTVEQLKIRLSKRQFLFMEFIDQGRYGKELYPFTVNTVRVVTARDKDGPWILYAVQRIGRKQSEPTDNFNKGGLCCPVDLESGRVGKGLYYQGQTKPTACTHHPDTGAPIAGKEIPFWTKMTETLLSAMAQLPGFIYVGWDVIIQDQNILILEGNSYPGVQVLQLHKPLLTDKRIARVFAEYGVISSHRLSSIGIDPAGISRKPLVQIDYDEDWHAL
jgi:hypothetical protein